MIGVTVRSSTKSIHCCGISDGKISSAHWEIETNSESTLPSALCDQSTVTDSPFYVSYKVITEEKKKWSLVKFTQGSKTIKKGKKIYHFILKYVFNIELIHEKKF